LNKKFINKKFLLIAAVILIIFLAMVYYIIASGTHYTSKDSNGNEISFNYPDGWAFQERVAGELIQGEKNGTDDSTYRSVVTINRTLASATSLDQVKSNNVYLKSGKIINETSRSVDGVEATVIDIEKLGGPERGKLGEVKLVLLSKEDYIYTITFVTGGTLEKMKDDIDHILNSFQTRKN
jgi:hypothetical protein